jgi:GNAT superfamily N-acetyltransferase
MRSNQGIGRELMRSAEEWARAQGCVEMASDALTENEPSQHAHEARDLKLWTAACTSAKNCEGERTGLGVLEIHCTA